MMLRCSRRQRALSFLFTSLCVLPIDSLISLNLLKLNINTKTCGAKPLLSTDASDQDDDDNPRNAIRRRQVLQSSITSLISLSQFPQVSHAGEVGARITKAVTTSDLGIAVRESVVRGAQTMDQLDSKWEAFSDKFGLGAARKQQPDKPAPKVIPDPLPLDAALAKRILETSDQTFVTISGISQDALTKQVETVATKVRPSFERAGASLEPGSAQAFNFDSYTHYKAYSDLIMTANIPFNSFKRDFESKMGQELLLTFLPQYKSTLLDNKNLQAALMQRLSVVNQLCAVLCEKGFVAATEISPVDDERMDDWSQDLSDLTFNVALDGDITMNAQILLQEQGFRLYPNYAKYAIARILQLPQQTVTIDDYYMDTDYNSDPDQFQVKEVMLNIVLDSAT